MLEFRSNSSFCHFLREVPRIFQTVLLRPPYLPPDEFKVCSMQEKVPLSVKVALCKNKKAIKHSKLFDRVLHFVKHKTSMNFKNSADWIESNNPDLTLPSTKEIYQKFSIPGHNKNEKRRNMQILADANPAFCWERIQFLHRCYTFNDKISLPNQKKGKWNSIRKAAWKRALNISEAQVLLGAKMVLRQKLLPDYCANMEAFLIPEHQIHRKDFQNYLQAFQHHIHNHLLKLESLQHKVEEHCLYTLPGTQKEQFVIDLCTDYWKQNPLAKHDEVYQYYLLKCPSNKILSESSLKRIIRKRKLDPRPPGSKKRGKGEKTYQI